VDEIAKDYCDYATGKYWMYKSSDSVSFNSIFIKENEHFFHGFTPLGESGDGYCEGDKFRYELIQMNFSRFGKFAREGHSFAITVLLDPEDFTFESAYGEAAMIEPVKGNNQNNAMIVIDVLDTMTAQNVLYSDVVVIQKPFNAFMDMDDATTIDYFYFVKFH